MIEDLPFPKGLLTVMYARQLAPLHCIMFLVVMGHSTATSANEVTAKAAVTSKSPVPPTSLVSELFDEEILAENIFAVRHRAFAMPEAERYAFLADWVLPSGTHSTIRMSGAFAPADPSSIVAREYRDATGAGGTLVSPAFDLLDLATKLGLFKELRARVAAIPEPATEPQQRARTSLRILLALELNEESAIESDVKKLQKMVTSMTPKSMADQWPETLVAFRSVTKFPKSSACDIVSVLVSQRVQRDIPKNCSQWHSQIVWLAGHHKTQEQLGTNLTSESTDKLRNWIPANRTRGARDALGTAAASWRFRNDECMHVTGKDEDYLLYRSPLTGTFDVELDVPRYGSTYVLSAGISFAPSSNPSELGLGNVRKGGGGKIPVEPPFKKLNDMVRCRASFRDGTRTLYVNGRVVLKDSLPEHHDPWIGVRSWYRSDASFRNVRISGNPVIPDSVVLSESADLTGWFSHLDESINYENAYWNYSKNGDQPAEIVGRTLTWHYDTISERLLRYFRPLAEDGSIEYEFLYAPGKAVTHPALDRLAFIIAPDGVRIHWVTDDCLDRTGVLPNNETVELKNRRGSGALPLKPGAWNHMKVAVKADVVALELNGQPIYERTLEPGNRRIFGLFNFADQSESRVRRVVMRGDWPKTIAPAAKQELTTQQLTSLDTQRSNAAASIIHQFSTDGLPKEYFDVPPATEEFRVAMTDRGVTHDTKSPGGWTERGINGRFELHGSFDVSVGFDDMQTTKHDHHGACLVVACGSGHVVQLGRKYYRKNDDQEVVVAWMMPGKDGEPRTTYYNIKNEAIAGHLRIARRGDVWYALYAENDSTSYQLVSSQKMEGTDNVPATFEFRSIATDGGTSHVVWKDVQVAADKLMIFPDPTANPNPSLFVMNVDGSNLRKLALNDSEITSPGSPDWSPDGKQIAFDQFSTSSIYLARADGTGLKKIGSGVMPTFSPDGKRLAFSGNGMSVMDLDGSNVEVLSEEGWGAQWSPNGKWIAFELREQVGNSITSNITIIDVETRQQRTILEGEQAERYSQIFWNMEWSPDSRQICFKGRVQGAGNEMAIANVEGSSKGFSVVTSDEVVEDFSWHPDGSKILMAKHAPQYPDSRLFVCDPKTLTITLLESQPMDQKNVSGVWSPDGSQIVFISTPKPKAVPWIQKGARKTSSR